MQRRGAQRGARSAEGNPVTWNYHNPVDIHFGRGRLAALPALARGRTVSLVTFPEAPGIGLVDRVSKLLGSQLVQVIDHTTPNPDVAELTPMYREFWAGAGGELLVAIGGGSVIDTA